MLDLLENVNRTRSTQTISAIELLNMVYKLPNVKVELLDGVRVAVHKNSSLSNDIYKLIEHNEGLSIEEIAVKLNCSSEMLRIWIQRLLEQGRLVIDDRLEGKFFYKNMILEWIRQ